jgi:hypothetical protein
LDIQPGLAFYDCLEHEGQMRGEIVTVPAVQPPLFQILGLQVGSNLVLTSTGADHWTINPEFTANQLTTNRLALTVQTNGLRNGTNEVI